MTDQTDAPSEIEAEFALEISVRCPKCDEWINEVQVVRMLRTRVNFTSGLPRRGQGLICPKCRVLLAGSLGGMI